MDANDMSSDFQEILLAGAQIQGRLAQMAAVVDQDYAGHEVLLVGILRGVIIMMADLARKPHVPVAMSWVVVSSYSSRAKSSGVIRILKDSSTDIKDRHVLIVGGTVDSDLTLSWLKSSLWDHGCASLNITVLLCRPNAAKTTINPCHIGFDTPSKFVVGYGLGYTGKYRSLPFVGLLTPHVYE